MATLLVVDDDEQMLSSLLDALATIGHKVAGAASGLQALELAQETEVDLVVSDVRMAGMDGIETITRLTERRPDLKSIIITGYASDDVPVRAMDLSSCDYLFKPFTAEQLVQSVMRALNKPERRPGHFPPQMEEAMAAIAQMEAARQRALQNYYLGVRSAHLGASSALAIYDHLEEAELLHQALEKQLELRFHAADLQARFEAITQQCKHPLTAKRKEGGVSRVTFQGLFGRIRDGSLACEEIRTAIYARQRLNEAGDPLEASVSHALFTALWGG